MWTALPVVLALMADPSTSPSETPRKPHPLAPSLPQLTEEEEDRIDQVIEQFILADTGRLRGPEAKKAMADFRALGPEATFSLIRGMNKAAAIDHSCPAVTIARKLSTFLRSSDDPQLLIYARESIGLGVTRSKHMGVLKDLKIASASRLSALKNQRPADLRNVPGPNPNPRPSTGKIDPFIPPPPKP